MSIFKSTSKAPIKSTKRTVKPKLPTLSRPDIADAVAAKSGLTKTKARDLVDTLIDVIRDAVASGKRVELRSFAIFAAVQKSARTARNPQTGARVQVPARRVVRAKVSPLFLPRVSKAL